MAIEAQYQCTESKPVLHRASRGVAGWECRIEVTMPGASGFDFIRVAAPQPWKPVSAWTQAELDRLLLDALPTLNKFRELVGIVQFRSEFTIEESCPLLTGKGASHELSSR